MGSPLVTFPGTSGNYVSSDSQNLLDADTAHYHQSVGAWVAGADTTAFIHDTGGTPAPPYGSGTAKATTDGTGPLIASLTTPTLAAVEHTFSVDVWSATAGREGFVTFDGTAGTVVALSAGWTRLSATKTVTAGTKAVTVSYRQLDDSAPAAAEDVWLARACIRTGTSAVFVPSLRIVGDIDLRSRVAAVDWITGAYQTLVPSCYESLSNLSYWGNITPTGHMGFGYSRDGSVGTVSTADSTVIPSLTNGAAYEFRIVFDTVADEVKFYVDGVQLGSTLTGLTDEPFPISAGLSVGATALGTQEWLAGDFYWAEVRDGIDGPVVRRFDAEDPLIANLFALNIPNGLTWIGEDTATWTANGADLDVSGEFALTDYAENELADHIAGTGAYTMPTAVYLKLHIGDPGESAATNAAVEATRKVLTFGVAAAGVALNDAAATWTSVSTTETYTHWSLWDHVSAGNPLVYGALTYPVAATAGDTIQLPVGGLSVKAR